MNLWFTARFPGSARYWDLRYRLGGTSGAGSYGADRVHKTAVINGLIEEKAIRSIIDFGCGDGSQLRDLKIDQYLGFDVSDAAVARCRELYQNRPGCAFAPLTEYSGQQASMAMSLDVLYHLVEDTVYFDYLDRLFAAALDWVLVYSSNTSPRIQHQARHVRHREFIADVETRFPCFELVRTVDRPEALGGPGPGRAQFFLFARSREPACQQESSAREA